MSTEPIDTERVRAKVKPWLQSVTLEDGALFPEEQDYLIVTCLRLCDEIDRLRANDEHQQVGWRFFLGENPHPHFTEVMTPTIRDIGKRIEPVYVKRSTSEPTPHGQVGEGLHPWLVVDTWAEKRPIGCWKEAAAKSLIPAISTPLERGRYVVVPRAALDPVVVDTPSPADKIVGGGGSAGHGAAPVDCSLPPARCPTCDESDRTKTKSDDGFFTCTNEWHQKPA